MEKERQTELNISIVEKAKALLQKGEVSRVLAWKEGVLPHLPEPAFFDSPDEAKHITYTKHCGANLSKFLIGIDVKILAFLRFCDNYSLNLLLKENQVKRENVHIVGIGCLGICDEKDQLIETCRSCTKKSHVVYDELMCEELHPTWDTAHKNTENKQTATDSASTQFFAGLDNSGQTSFDRYALVYKVESMNQEEKYDFWQNELKRCIRCNACRNICPVCHCKKCVFDGEKYDSRQIVNVSSFEEQMFHIIRAYHVAGRCSDCGQCSRVCPQKIPLHILNRKFIKDVNEFFGEYSAGEDAKTPNPLVCFDVENDPEV